MHLFFFINFDYALSCFVLLLQMISSCLHTRYLLVPCAYVSIESVDCILSLLALHAILLNYPVNTLCFLLLNLYCDFNFDLLFLMILYDFLLNYLYQVYFFLGGLFLFQVDLSPHNFHNLQI